MFRSCILLLILTLPAAAQVDFRISGYAVNFPIYQRTNSFLAGLVGTDQNQFTDVTRLRIRPSVGLWEDTFVMLEYEINATYFSSPQILLLPLSQSPGRVFDLTWNPVKKPRWNVVHFIDRLYLKQITDRLDLTIGRQRISWGTGRIWNPTDLFNPINPTSFAKLEKDGVDAVVVKFIMGNFTDISFVVNPGNEWEDANLGVRLRTNVEAYDFSLMGGTFSDGLVLGGDFAGSILDAGVRGEAIHSWSKSARGPSYAKFILGIDNQFTEEFYALAEYHFNGQGRNRVFEYELFALRSGSILNLGRQFMTIQGSYLVHPLITVSAGYTNSFTDGSGFATGSVAYSAAEFLTCSAGGQVFHGDDFDEYWYYPT
ncbi:MAG TPA: hypothetical protein VGA55_03195, partial [Bacteroidota bacterium]